MSTTIPVSTDIINPKLILLSFGVLFTMLSAPLTPLGSVTWAFDNIPLLRQITQYSLFTLFVYAISGGDKLTIIISCGIVFIFYQLILQIDKTYYPSQKI